MTRKLAIAVSTIGFGQSAFIALVPLTMDRLGLGSVAIGTAAAAAAGAFLIGSPFWGAAGARIGQGRLLRGLAVAMFVGQALFATLFLARPEAPAITLVILIASRLIYGAAASGVMPTAQAWVSRSVGRDQRRGALGLLSAGVSIGRLAGSVAAGLAAMSPLLPLVLFTVSPALLWLAPNGNAAKTENASGAGRLLPFDRRVLPMLAIGFCLTAGFSQVQIVLGPLIAGRFDLDAGQATSATGLALTVVALVMIAVQVLLVPRLRSSERAGVVAGGLIAAIATVTLTATVGYLASGAALACAGLGIAMATPGYVAWLMGRVEPFEQGRAAGWLASTHVLGQSVGALSGGYLFTWSPDAPLIACCCFVLAAALIAGFTRKAG